MGQILPGSATTTEAICRRYSINTGEICPFRILAVGSQPSWSRYWAISVRMGCVTVS